MPSDTLKIATNIFFTKWPVLPRVHTKRATIQVVLQFKQVTFCNEHVRVGAKYIGTCRPTCLYLSTFFRVLACTLYLSFKNVLVPKYITKYLVLEDKYIASTFVPKNIYYNLLFQLFSAIFLRI